MGLKGLAGDGAAANSYRGRSASAGTISAREPRYLLGFPERLLGSSYGLRVEHSDDGGELYVILGAFYYIFNVFFPRFP